MGEGAGASRRARLGRQPRQPGGRDKRIDVKVTGEELEALQHRARALGVSVPRLLVQSALGGGASLPERHALYRELAAIRLQLIRTGTNLNQVAHHANAFDGELGADAEGAVADSQAAVAAAVELLGRLPVPPARAVPRATGEPR